MSIAIKIMLGVVLTLTVLLGIETYLFKAQSDKLAQVNQRMEQLNQNIAKANEAVETQTLIAETTDQVVTSATKRIMKNTERGEAIKAVVDNVTKKVANEKLSGTIADTAYVNSMWDAYCTAKPSDRSCTSRQSSY